jgi:hypothetical protein
VNALHGSPAQRAAAVALCALSLAFGSGAAIRDEEPDRLLFSLSSSDSEAADTALRTITVGRDVRFVAPLIELMRAQEIGVAPGIDRESLVRALEAISGQEFGADWPAWVRWYSETDLRPPPGFTGWKGELLSRIDSRFALLLPFGAPARVRVEEIVWGGVAFEGIPALDLPKMVAANEADYLEDDEPVFGIALNGDARAYPLRILDWHEMANDLIGGIPVSLAYCTLCGSGIAYDGRAPDGKRYDFGSSGFLMRSNKLMVDRQTRSLWNQFTGQPVVGPLAEEDFRLRILPSVLATWEKWRNRHPDTRVLSLDTGYARPYRPGAAYADYFASDGLMFPVREGSRALAPKARVFGLELEGLPKGYPLDRLMRERVVNDRVGPTNVVIVTSGEPIRVKGRSARTRVERTYQAGAAVRAYRRRDLRFSPGGEPDIVVDASGTPWMVREEALLGPGDTRLERLPGVLAYWFGWNAYHPRTGLYDP